MTCDPNKCIPLEQCVRGGLYKLNSRNLISGVYDGEQGFIGIREKFSRRYLFPEYHVGPDGRAGTARPTEFVVMLPEDIAPVWHLAHPDGDLWLQRPGKFDNGEDIFVPVIRRDLAAGEQPHGGRQGFVDEFVGGQRIPDDEYPFMRSNKRLFEWLEQQNAPIQAEIDRRRAEYKQKLKERLGQTNKEADA